MFGAEYIIGIPSGEIIYIKPNVVNFLKQGGFIFYDMKFRTYMYNDLDYDLIIKALKSINPDTHNTRFARRVLDFMGTQKNIKSYNIGKDSSVEVDGSVVIVGNIKFDALPFRFNSVSGDFIIRDCRLQNLRGSPKKISGNFIVSGNELYDLSDGPEYVGGNYDCSDNVLTTLAGSPDVIKGDFDCSENLLTNLKGSPIRVWGTFDCSSNKFLTNIYDAPISGQLISDVKK